MSQKRPIPRQNGFSLIEIMIGLVMGMLLVIIIMQTLSVAEGLKRTTTGAGDAQTTAAISLFTLEQDLRAAGFGFNNVDANGPMGVCTLGTLTANNSNRSPADISFTAGNFAPFVINPSQIPAGDGGSDVIQVVYDNNFGIGSMGTTFTQQGGADGDYKVKSRTGFRQGDMVLVVQPGYACSLAEITSLPGSGRCGDAQSNVNTDIIKHTAITYNSFYVDPTNCALSTPSTWNGGTKVTYTSGMIYNFGPSAGVIVRVYAVRGQRLTVCNRMAADCTDATKLADSTVWTPIGDDIVALKAIYGKDDGATGTAGDGIVDTWDINTPTTFEGWTQVVATRVALVARSKQYEKNTVTTVSAPAWQGSTVNPIDLSNLSDYGHYRYRVLQTTIPFRNLLWGH
ncbi:PilW family protein [Azospira inquinata]|uniref:PilW family protein n=1 Tax=Azospira inquinata TaxID=2785627 RepID=A0A975XV96_9RHOO|nr:PilW family protein [Azospira inquinata]QWT45073.1 PilW family protein [Azospira inquinata]QWT49594.1 PilW family protein [Azospira inquinata]